ncbi:hypothetical protein CL621_01200 [archaeon]|nr:hypothetical protein [archaeon]|tara:strand:+ start:744 stop:1505 length:762 start_codon:yes stop_codon:yes gene_type:complete
MKKAPEKQVKIIADLHSHPGTKNSTGDIMDLLSDGITGLTATNSGLYILNYEDVLLKFNGVKEIDKGLFAELSYNGKKGYFVKAQEVRSNHHILSVGCEKYLDDYEDSRKTVEEIHKHGGLAILNHPSVVSCRFWPIKYRLVNEDEEKEVRELCEMVDEVEVFNAQNINLIPAIAWMKKANVKAKELAAEYGFKGIASSDAHLRLEQVKTSGIYVPEEDLSIESLKYNIMNQNFDRFEQYVSISDFLKGHFSG